MRISDWSSDVCSSDRPVERRNTIILSDQALYVAGLSQLSLWTSGSLTFDEGTDLVLRPGGVLVGQSGRAVTVDGTITAASGAIDLKTFNISGGSAFADDDPAAGSFDIVVNGSLSTRGRWVNDLNSATDEIGRTSCRERVVQYV